MEALIYGAGKLGREVLRILIAENSVEIIGFLDDDRSDSGSGVERFRVIGNSSDLSRYRSFGVEGICVAAESGEERLRIAGLAEKAGYYLLTVKSDSSFISPDAHPGRGCIFLENSRVENGAVIQHCSLIGKGVEIGSSSCIPAGSNIVKTVISRQKIGAGKPGKNSDQQTDITRGGVD